MLEGYTENFNGFYSENQFSKLLFVLDIIPFVFTISAHATHFIYFPFYLPSFYLPNILDEFLNNGGDYALQGQTQFQARGGMTPQRPMMNKGMYPGYMPQQQQQPSSPFLQQQQHSGMTPSPQIRGMMPRYPNPPGVKRSASSMYGQNIMGNGPPMGQQQQQQSMQGNFPPFPAQVKQEPNFPPQYPVSLSFFVYII